MSEPIPLALLPGLLLDARLWQPQRDALADIAEIRVPDLTQADSMEGLADAVLSIMPERFALAGLSMGGSVAFEVVRRAPERVTRLALLDTRARVDPPEQAARRRGFMELARKGRFRGVTPQLLPSLIHPDRLKDAALTQLIMEMAEAVGRDAFLRQQTALLNRPDNLPLLPWIDVPTLVLCGRQDALTPLHYSEEMHAGIRGSRLVIVEEAGHLPPLERPAAVNAALRDWLTGAAA